jgi:hypothetical protein
MKWYLTFVLYNLLNINYAVAMDCNPKQLNSIVEEFTTKIMTDASLTRVDIEKTLRYCTLTPSNITPSSTSLIKKKSPSSSDVIKAPETRQKLNEFMSACNDLITHHPETRDLITLVQEAVSDKVKEIDNQKQRLELWKKRKIEKTSSVQTGTTVAKHESLFDFLANADSKLSKP